MLFMVLSIKKRFGCCSSEAPFHIKNCVIVTYRYFSRTTVAPKGLRERPASLKNCLPNGIPMIVMHQRTPQRKFPIASTRPPKIIQSTFSRNEPAPPSYFTSFPKGFRDRLASLKHCSPTGMPMIVIHQRTPVISQPRALKSPPKMIHKIFPINLMIQFSFLSYSMIFFLCSLIESIQEKKPVRKKPARTGPASISQC